MADENEETPTPVHRYIDKPYFERNLKKFYNKLNVKFKELADKISALSQQQQLNLTEQQKKLIVDTCYRPGSYWLTETSENPNEVLGGTWVLEHESLKNSNPYWQPGWGEAAFMGGINVWRRIS